MPDDRLRFPKIPGVHGETHVACGATKLVTDGLHLLLPGNRLTNRQTCTAWGDTPVSIGPSQQPNNGCTVAHLKAYNVSLASWLHTSAALCLVTPNAGSVKLRVNFSAARNMMHG